ncbi:MAG: YicC/YloC family endoribonuclease [Paracoccaceae bacterium]|nr:YicC/YloC family endoribonuclease [Paracoccaceae bacterium]
MTGFASLAGNQGNRSWAWEMRSVNARGLDIRLRLPEGLGDLELALRKAIGARFARGNISVGLRLQAAGGNGAASLNSDQLDQILEALRMTEARAQQKGLHLTASSAADILSLRGVLDTADENDDISTLVKTLKDQIPPLLDSFAQARAAEGRALAMVLGAQLDQIEKLVEQARRLAEERREQMGETLRRNLALVLENSDGVDPDRLAQELALIAVKADVTEEIDRLNAHVAAARALLETDAPVGRKFDFLMQEFNREANTLCSKSGSTDLTRIGLDLKTVIDQMREQVQNVE